MKIHPRSKYWDAKSVHWERTGEREYAFISPAIRRDFRQSGGFVPRSRGTWSKGPRRNQNMISWGE